VLWPAAAQIAPATSVEAESAEIIARADAGLCVESISIENLRAAAARPIFVKIAPLMLAWRSQEMF
jgi:hypothetical protein